MNDNIKHKVRYSWDSRRLNRKLILWFATQPRLNTWNFKCLLLMFNIKIDDKPLKSFSSWPFCLILEIFAFKTQKNDFKNVSNVAVLEWNWLFWQYLSENFECNCFQVMHFFNVGQDLSKTSPLNPSHNSINTWWLKTAKAKSKRGLNYQLNQK